MDDTKANLMLHPIRLRIINLLYGRTLTPQQIGAVMDDVAHATLYRHIKALTDGGVLEVVEERQVRGTVERVYTLKLDATRLTGDDVNDLSADEHEQYFTAFLFSLVEDFRRYLDISDTPNLQDDFVRYNKAALYLSAEEADALGQSITTLVTKFTTHPPAPERKRYLLTLVTMPDADVDIPEDKETNS